MIKVSVAPNIRYTKLDELLTNVPKVVTVNKFTEESAHTFAQDIQSAVNTGQPIIPLVIDSYGGQVYSVLSMIDTMRQVTSVPIATIAKGKSMSCGAILFSQGTEGYRFMSPFATLMIHDVSSGSLGKTEEIKSDARETERLNDLVYSLMAKGTGKDDSKYFWKIVHDKGRADWFLDANEARYHNLANHIKIPNFKINVTCDISFE